METITEPYQCPDCKRIDGVTEGYCPWCLRGEFPKSKTTFDQDFKEKVMEIASELSLVENELTKLIKFAKRFYDMGKEG